MENSINIFEKGKTFSSYHFYNNFLKEVALFYKSHSKDDFIEFNLTIDDEIPESNSFFIDPITLPLIVSLSEQLMKFHNSPLKLNLSNNYNTNNLLAFLDRSDFFYLVGDNFNPTYPKGRNILSFDKRYLGNFNNRLQKPEHKLREYSLKEDNLEEEIRNLKTSEDQRDFLVEHYLYKVKEHFGVLLNSNDITREMSYEYIDILAELITNGVLHSESNTYVLMFTDRFKSKFSISDNGKGLYKSLTDKDVSDIGYYKKFEIFDELKSVSVLKINEQIENSLLAIFETLFYSMLKDRNGLFDLMCNVVLNCNGYFRLHNENAQIIISARMLDELNALNLNRQQIKLVHNQLLFESFTKEEFDIQMTFIVKKVKKEFIELAKSIFKKYTIDTRYSSIRLFDVKFKGVHVEVEIPNMN
jgi:hypothetical protein